MSRPSSRGTATPSGGTSPSIRPFAANSTFASGLSSTSVGVAETSASTCSAPEEPSRIEAKVEGTPLGVVGRLTATSVTTLSDDGDGTRIAYEVDAALTGKLGSLGQPVLRAKAKEMERRFAERMRAAFADSKSTSETAP